MYYFMQNLFFLLYFHSITKNLFSKLYIFMLKTPTDKRLEVQIKLYLKCLNIVEVWLITE